MIETQKIDRDHSSSNGEAAVFQQSRSGYESVFYFDLIEHILVGASALVMTRIFFWGIFYAKASSVWVALIFPICTLLFGAMTFYFFLLPFRYLRDLLSSPKTAKFTVKTKSIYEVPTTGKSLLNGLILHAFNMSPFRYSFYPVEISGSFHLNENMYQGISVGDLVTITYMPYTRQVRSLELNKDVSETVAVESEKIKESEQKFAKEMKSELGGFRYIFIFFGFLFVLAILRFIVQLFI